MEIKWESNSRAKYFASLGKIKPLDVTPKTSLGGQLWEVTEIE